MNEVSDKPVASLSPGEKGLAILERFSRALPPITAALGAIVAAFGAMRPQFLLIGGPLLLAGLVWLAIRMRQNYTRRRRPMVAVRQMRSPTLIRGLRPMNNSDDLLGRDRDIDLIVLMVQAPDYRCGFLSGEAGAGKTSLLRAGLIKQLMQQAVSPHIVYVPRSGAKPAEALRHQLVDLASATAGAKSPLAELLVKQAPEGTRTITVILDQFEEFFITNRNLRDHRETEREFSALLKYRNTEIRLLFALRKDFVDDLLSFFGQLGFTVATGNRYPLLNFPEPVAQEVLEEISRREDLPFSAELRRRVIADLARDERVRPVEFQVVLSRMLENQIADARSYEEAGGAWGIISRYIADEIGAPSSGVVEFQRQIARHLLRALCSDHFDARRPNGLTLAELYQRIAGPLQPWRQAQGIGEKDTREVFDETVGKLRNAYILIDEAQDRVNLAHDYLAPAIRDATADIETSEERANRLLEQFAARERAGERLVILPRKVLRDVRRYADPELRRRTHQRNVLRRSTRFHVAGTALVAVAAIGVPTYLTLTQPTGWVIREAHAVSVEGSGQLSADGRLAAWLDGDKLTIVDSSDTRTNRYDIPGSYQAVILSPGGDEAMLLTKDGRLFTVNRGSGFKPVLKLKLGWINAWRGRWAAYSKDGSRKVAATLEGEVRSWSGDEKPVLIGRFKPRVQNGPLPPDAKPTPYRGGDAPGMVVPERVGVSPNGKFVAVVAQDFGVWRTDPGGPAVLVSDTARHNEDFSFSPDGNSIAWIDAGHVLWKDLAGSAQSDLGEIAPSGGRIKFSPSGRWLVFRASFDRFSTWKVGAASPPNMIGAAPPDRQSKSDSGTEIDFDSAERLVAGRNWDRRAHYWELGDSTPRLVPIREPGTDDDETFQNLRLCIDGKHALFSMDDGPLLRVDTGNRQVVGQIEGKRKSSFSGSWRLDRSKDSDLVYFHNERVLGIGNCSAGDWDQWMLAGSVSDLHPLPDGHLLNVLTDRDLLQFERRFVLWGMPIPWLRQPWPQLFDDH